MTSATETTGRIHKKTFVACNLSLFIVCIVSVIVRFYIRLRVQKRFQVDDGILLFGIACLIAAVVLFYFYVDMMYMTEALVLGRGNVTITPNFFADSMEYHKIIITALVLSWWSLMAVKLCFLCLFRQLVDRIKPMIRFWWFTVVFNLLVAIYVMYIPCRLIWKVRIKLAQKLALASCLCLTVVVMVCTIMRVTGLSYYTIVDATWETFWQYMSASVGLTMTSVAAFRSLFISHHVGNKQRDLSDLHYIGILYEKFKEALRRTFGVQSWRTSEWYSQDKDPSEKAHDERFWHLGRIERGTITGLRTFIHQHQRQPTTASGLMYSQPGKEVYFGSEQISSDGICGANVAADTLQSETFGRGGISKPEQTYGLDKSGRRSRIAAYRENRRNHKILAHQESRNNDKMLNSQESRKHDKMLARHANSEHDKVVAMASNSDDEAILPMPRRVRSSPNLSGNDSVCGTGDSGFGGSGSWPRGSRSDRRHPKTRVSMMSKVKCGGFVFSAGVKAERFGEKS
ncbi:MAG: hypothetical protein Q9218_005095 [Villophora microphyllina]